MDEFKAIPQMRKIKEAALVIGMPEHFVRNLVWQKIPIYVMAGRTTYIHMGKLVDYLNGELAMDGPQEIMGNVTPVKGFFKAAGE